MSYIPAMLLSKGAVPVDTAAYVEAVTHHALGEQKKDHCHDDYKQETSDSESRWLSSCPDARFRHTRYFTPRAASRAGVPKSHVFGACVALHSASEESITYAGDQFGDFGTPSGAGRRTEFTLPPGVFGERLRTEHFISDLIEIQTRIVKRVV